MRSIDNRRFCISLSFVGWFGKVLRDHLAVKNAYKNYKNWIHLKTQIFRSTTL
jgi:hypothetical protein